MSLAHLLSFIAMCLLWGGSYLMIHFSVQTFPPITAAALRVLLAVVGLFVWCRVRKLSLKASAADVRTILMIGAWAMGIPFALLFWGEQFVTPALTAILVATAPLYTLIFMPLILRGQAASVRQWCGVVLGFCGMLLVFTPALQARDFHDVFGMLAILGTAVCYGLSTLGMRRHGRHIRTTVVQFYVCLGALCFLAPAALLLDSAKWSQVAWGDGFGWISLLYLGLCSTAVGYLIYINFIREVGSLPAAMVNYAIPIVSIVLDAIVLRRIPPAPALVGMCVVFAGVTLVQVSPRKLARALIARRFG